MSGNHAARLTFNARCSRSRMYPTESRDCPAACSVVVSWGGRVRINVDYRAKHCPLLFVLPYLISRPIYQLISWPLFRNLCVFYPQVGFMSYKYQPHLQISNQKGFLTTSGPLGSFDSRSGEARKVDRVGRISRRVDQANGKP